ncbi:hypothetical protein WJX81_002716 [Elliptochloris bilobata]|uniref:Aminotransferase class V domain-containing protein n=1 Tax=Elliptochloris bilobata TaxID=381761 RepID=A0AAW1RTR1_9CHLO
MREGTAQAAHFNAAGSSLPSRATVEAQRQYLEVESTIGGYEAIEREASALRRPYQGLAKLLNCEPEEVAILQSATSAWTQVFYGLELSQGDRILTSQHEYSSNYNAFLQVGRRTGAAVEVIPEEGDGEISVAGLERLIAQGRRPALVAITHVPTNCGRVYDAAAVGAVTQQHGIPFLLDACQSVGQMPVDVRAIGCDWLTGTARKFLRGPRGVGFLYASKAAMARTEPAMIDLWGATWVSPSEYRLQRSARRYEFYEKDFSGVVALGVAVDEALELGMDWIWGRIRELAALLRSLLADAPGCRLHDSGRTLCGIVAFSVEGMPAADVRARLREQGICVWISPASSTLLDFQAHGLPPETVRASVHYYNTEAEIAQLARAVAALEGQGGTA